ncbi:uncharacterized protein zbtb4 isoform X1 [Girardinichthys multiradiatus]|uniref:uncharacterized protein zbtb4 isoform X1 n=2 Tax=Girardinichthys multiradiatus TaxID=208333 RepID=UPI001FAC3F4F|nr:uncharacterized protein zbtb4 isoform X1 [Girardinichthys multiradiatus]
MKRRKRFRGLVMVSSAKVWDPPHVGLTQPHLREQRLAPGLTPLCNSSDTAAKDTELHESRELSPLSSPPPPLVTLSTSHPIQHPPVSLYIVSKTEPLIKPAHSLGVVSQSEEEEAEQLNMKGKRLGYRVEATLDDKLEDMGDGPKNAKITLSFPLGAAPLPTSLTSPDHCHSSSSTSPSPQRRRLSSKSSDRGALWKLDATMDVKHRPFKPSRHDSSPSSSPSSSSSPMATFIRKDLKSPPPLKCSKLSSETQIHRSPPRASSGPLGGCFGGDGWDERHKVANGTASPSQTAQILFSLGTSAYQRGVDTDRKEKLTGRPVGKTGSPHRPSLHPPTLDLPPPLPPPPPPPSEGLTAPPHSSSYPPPDGMKPELICGVCHRLFSSASSLTVHMRLHRGSRALSCRYCGKVFIHSKRLQSHETSCGAPGLRPPALTVQPKEELKEEPLEDGEVRVEGGVIVGQTDISKGRPGKKVRSLLARIQAGDPAATELLAGDENHFVKVVDGNVIYFCSVCERSYMTLSSLKRHSNVHSWRRKYPCHYCDKVFALAEYRTKHEVWHTGERRYQCIFCWDAFATYYNLKTHQKTIHGINPSLISSEKTANGGYKQKANALKLYRLLPMRSQKRPYKTYSDSLHNGLLLPPADTPSLSLPGLGCALGSGDLQSIIAGAPSQSLKPDPDAFSDGFPISLAAEHRDLSELALESQLRTHESEALELEQEGGSFKMSHNSKHKTLKAGRGTETGMPSVITYGHTKPSVIVHGAAVSSSVIVHSNQVTSGSEKSPVTSPSPETSNSQISIKGSPKAIKKQRDNTDNHRKRSRDSLDTANKGSKGRHNTETGRGLHKSRKSHNKTTITISKGVSASGSSQAKESGPLCQITVRIGEEAIVKRSISETDLKRDKSLSPQKIKRSETPSVKEPRHTHSHHHHHKHRPLSRASMDEDGGKEAGDDEEEQEEMEEQDGRDKSSKSPDQVREYFFRKGVREQDSDNDIEDNLWRPYYTYKPKKKAQAHLQRVKNWQRKLKYKRSIRLKRRAERLKRLLNKQTEKSQDEEEDRTTVEAEKPNKDVRQERKKDNLSSPLKEKKQDVEEQVKEACHEVSTPPVRSPKPPLSTSMAPTGIKRRPWTNGNAAECGTCGRWFSSPRKRDKHELSHLLEFVCLFCRATFPSREKLEDHQKAQHPKPTEAPSVATKCGEQTAGVGIKSVPEISKHDEDKEGLLGLGGSNSSPSRLSRRALSRHTCPQCHKVCKTSSALTRHIRRHDLSSSPEREKEDNNSEAKPPQTVSEPLCTDPETDKGQTPSALSVSVISYSPAELPSGGDCLASQQHDDHSSELIDKHLKLDSSEEPELTQLALFAPEIEPIPQPVDLPLESPVNLTPTKPEVPPATPSSLQSVLVMNESECLDYRTTIKKSLDGQSHRKASPLHFVTSINTSLNVPMTSQTRITPAAPPVSMTTAPSSEGGFTRWDGVIIDRERQSGSGTILHTGYKELPLLQGLRVQALSRSPSPNEAQDLTMSSILAREREIERQREAEVELDRQRERRRNKEIEKEKISRVAYPPQEQTSLIVPKEEPLSPVASPQHMSTQTTINGPCLRRHTPKSPCRPPSTTGLMAQASRQVHLSSQGLDRLTLPTGAVGATDRPSAHALLLPRASQPPGLDHQDTFSGIDSQQGDTTPADYPSQDYPLPLIVPDSYRSVKKHEENLLMSTYPPGALPFGPLGKVIVPDGGDLGKLPFYPDPYQLLYGPQLLAYPYNLAALPVALNMMAPGGDKVEPLPYLPTIFNYAATAGPYMGAAPHPLMANPGLYSSGGSGKKQRDGSSSKQ